jgi:hypothetical protein
VPRNDNRVRRALEAGFVFAELAAAVEGIALV